MIYLDHNATTPVLPEVILAMIWQGQAGGEDLDNAPEVLTE